MNGYTCRGLRTYGDPLRGLVVAGLYAPRPRWDRVSVRTAFPNLRILRVERGGRYAEHALTEEVLALSVLGREGVVEVAEAALERAFIHAAA